MPKLMLSPDVQALNPDLSSALTVPGTSRYPNKRTQVDGIWFDSQVEAQHYGELVLRERAGEISDLQPSPAQPTKQRFALPGGLFYTPDFTYTEAGQRQADEVKGAPRGRSSKGTHTEASRMRIKLFREAYPEIELKVIER